MKTGARVVRAGLHACIAAVVACGGRSNLLDAGARAGSGGAATGSASGGGPAAPSCHAWSVAPGAPIALTDPIADAFGCSFQIDPGAGVVVEGDQVLIATWDNSGNVDPSPDPSWRVRVVSDDLATIGPSQVVLTHTESGGDPMTLASGFGHRGGIALDEDTCLFVPIADDGSAAAAPVKIAGGECFWLRATPGGFTAFLRPAFEPLVLLTLDPTGKVVGSKNGVGPPDGMIPHARARISDGSTLIAWPSFEAAINVQRWSAEGDALAGPKELLVMPAVITAAMAEVGGAVLVAWTPYKGDLGAILVQQIDVDGNPLGPPAKIADADGSEVRSLDITAAEGGALVAWTKDVAGASSVLTVQPVTAAGTSEGTPIMVPAPPDLGAVRVTMASAGAIVGFDGAQPGEHTRAFVTRLLCEQ